MKSRGGNTINPCTPAQIRGLRLAGNRINPEAPWNEDPSSAAVMDLSMPVFDLRLTRFEVPEPHPLLPRPLPPASARRSSVPRCACPCPSAFPFHLSKIV